MKHLYLYGRVHEDATLSVIWGGGGGGGGVRLSKVTQLKYIHTFRGSLLCSTNY